MHHLLLVKLKPGRGTENPNPTASIPWHNTCYTTNPGVVQCYGRQASGSTERAISASLAGETAVPRKMF